MSVKSPRPDPVKRATLKDLARALGISVSSVSNAYNHPGQLSDELRERILETAKRMGYSGPHPIARGLRRGRAGNLGVVYGERHSYAFADPAAVQFLQGISLVTEEEGVDLTLVSTPFESRSFSGIRNAVVDGFIFYSRIDPTIIAAAMERNLPAVLVDHDHDTLPSVSVNDAGGARAAARHLLELGHRRFGIISLERTMEPHPGWVAATDPEPEFKVSRERQRGYTTELKRAGLRWNRDYWIYACGRNARAEGATAMRHLLEQNGITAVLAMSDVLALGAVQTLRERGLRVPDDVAVVGYDDVPEALSADLTSVHQPHVEKGRLACQLLIRQLNGEPAPSPAPLEPHLVVRGSSGGPR